MGNNIKILRELETERLVLRPMSMSDNDFIFSHFSNADVCRYLVDAEPLCSLDEAKKLVEWFAPVEDQKCFRWVIFRKSDSMRMGTCGYHCWDTRNSICEIGYDLEKEFWGQGYMSEAVVRILKVGFETMGLNRVQAFVHLENIKSSQLLKKLGFKEEGIFRDKHYFRGAYYDHYCFSILKREYAI